MKKCAALIPHSACSELSLKYFLVCSKLTSQVCVCMQYQHCLACSSDLANFLMLRQSVLCKLKFRASSTNVCLAIRILHLWHHQCYMSCVSGVQAGVVGSADQQGHSDQTANKSGTTDRGGLQYLETAVCQATSLFQACP